MNLMSSVGTHSGSTLHTIRELAQTNYIFVSKYMSLPEYNGYLFPACRYSLAKSNFNNETILYYMQLISLYRNITQNVDTVPTNIIQDVGYSNDEYHRPHFYSNTECMKN